jgi:hypothetical protein
VTEKVNVQHSISNYSISLSSKWILVPSGLAAVLSGLWMAQFYPWPEGDGVFLYGLRILFGSGMVLSIVLGAGTQVFTHLPWFLLVGSGTTDELSRAVMMVVGWVINLVAAEWIIRKRPFRRPRTASITL